ncbi:MAG: hypothetical protein H6658_04740 [Ardenticatenaceae bacterium]|nr:hypothetical protein [Ardenticatenaceae bacterium]
MRWGHGLPSLLPRKLFKQMPGEGVSGGKRPSHRKYNFCPSHEAGMSLIRQNARALLLPSSPATMSITSGPTTFERQWCNCALLKGYSASDQLLLAMNALAGAG